MRITNLEIYNFRGIRESSISFPLDSRIICMVGAGDSTKSTILKAIEWAFWPTWSLFATDSDFYNCDTTNQIIIRGTITEFPDSFLAEDKYGLYLRRAGVKICEGEDDEPQDEKPLCLTIQLTIDASLEPKWEIVCNRRDPLSISHNDRRQLFVGVIGINVAKDLAWGKNSVLQKYADTKGVLHEAYTIAVREAVNNADLGALDIVSDTLVDVGKKYGVFFDAEINSRFMIHNGSFSTSVGLFNGDTPLSQFGTGSQRLLSIGLNIGAAPGEAILLIDEVENGLEPYRLRSLINEFRSEHSSAGQIFMTTHSPVVLAECTIDEIMVVRSDDGITHALYMKGKDAEANCVLQAQIRKNTEAFLSKRIIVCEGSTEMGFIRAFDEFLVGKENFRMAHKGVSTADGHGTSIFQCSDILKNCGYDICILMDSDKDSEDDEKQRMREIGVPIFEWDKTNALEEQFFLELPLPAIQEAIQIAVEDKGYASVSGKLSAEGIPFSENNGCIIVTKLTIEQRKALGKAAKKKDWYKRIGLGEQLGRIILNNLGAMDYESTIRKIVAGLTEWVLKDDQTGV